MARKLLLLYPVSSSHLSRLQLIAPDWQIDHTVDAEEAKQKIISAEVVMGNHNLCESLPFNNGTLRWLQTNSTGIDYIVGQCGELLSNIYFTNAKGVYDEEMSEHVIALLLMLNRDLHTVRDNQQKKQWERPQQLSTLKDKQVVIVGYGSLGKCIEVKLKSFGPHIHGINSSCSYITIENEKIHWEDFIPQTDVLILCLPSTSSTKNLVGKSILEKLPASAIVINAGRSNTIDEDALFDLLENNRLRGAALDVFTKEPLPDTHKAWNVKNLIVSPHMARTKETEPPFKFESLFEENFKRYINDQPLLNIVDIKKGY